MSVTPINVAAALFLERQSSGAELMAPITAGGPLLDDYLAEMPISRLGTVDDIAAAVRFLAGPESSWISGECLGVDGGHHLRRGANYGLLFG